LLNEVVIVTTAHNVICVNHIVITYMYHTAFFISADITVLNRRLLH